MKSFDRHVYLMDVVAVRCTTKTRDEIFHTFRNTVSQQLHVPRHIVTHTLSSPSGELGFSTPKPKSSSKLTTPFFLLDQLYNCAATRQTCDVVSRSHPVAIGRSFGPEMVPCCGCPPSPEQKGENCVSMGKRLCRFLSGTSDHGLMVPSL